MEMSWDRTGMDGRGGYTYMPLDSQSPLSLLPQTPQSNPSPDTHPPPYSSSYFPRQNVQYPASISQDRIARPLTTKPKRSCPDFRTILLLITIWIFLIMTCAVLLFVTHLEKRADSRGGELLTADEISLIIAVSTLPIFFAAILNEILVEKCWRRVEYFALDRILWGRRVPASEGARMAQHLRAASFGWKVFLKRLVRQKASIRDWMALLSWIWLRFGTAIAIASTQFCVTWSKTEPSIKDGEQPLYTANKRLILFLLPIIIHSIAVFVIPMIWLKAPWTLFTDRYSDRGLLEKYEPYLQQVNAGSLATCDEVADYLEDPQRGKSSLSRINKPGCQVMAKLKGVSFGILFMNVPVVLALGYTLHVKHEVERSVVLHSGIYRFVFQMVFLTQNILYIVALDFIIWNISIEGICKSTAGDPGRPKSRRHLKKIGKSAGLTLLYKAIRQRKPRRAIVFIWLFWLQACFMRFLTMLYTFCIQVISYRSINDRKPLYDPNFWLVMLMVNAAITLPFIVAWLCTPSQAPICDQDGWRWACIMQDAYTKPGLTQEGYYGVITEVRYDGREYTRAAWGMNVHTFQSTKGKELI